MKSVSIAASLLVSVFLSAFSSFAQVKDSPGTSAVISGTVRDEAGKPIPYANIFIASTGEGLVAGDDGSFSFASSAAGSV